MYVSPLSQGVRKRNPLRDRRMQTKTAPVVSRAKAYLKVRQKAVRDAMKELKLDGLLLTYVNRKNVAGLFIR